VPDDGSDPGAPDSAPDPSRLTDALVPGSPDPAADRREPSLWYLAAAGALYTGLLLLLGSLVPRDLLERAEAEPMTFLLVQLLDDGLLAGVAVLFACLRYPGSWRGLGFQRVGVGWWAFGAAGGVAAAALAWVVSAGLEAWGMPVPPHPVENVMARAQGWSDLGVVLLAVTVPVALGEEVFFRGYAYRLLRARLGVRLALAGTAFLFALVHGLEPGAWLPILPVGLVFGLLVERSGSLWPAVAGHAVVNALAVLAG
jgi:membrane protease YdiL (CAAX protease family)